MNSVLLGNSPHQIFFLSRLFLALPESFTHLYIPNKGNVHLSLKDIFNQGHENAVSSFYDHNWSPFSTDATLRRCMLNTQFPSRNCLSESDHQKVIKQMKRRCSTLRLPVFHIKLPFTRSHSRILAYYGISFRPSSHVFNGLEQFFPDKVYIIDTAWYDTPSRVF